jgi:hypothetical protein
MTLTRRLYALSTLLVLALLLGCVPAATPQPVTALPAYESIPGVYLGTFHGTSSSSLRLFEQIGKGIAISGVYLNWRFSFQQWTSECQFICGANNLDHLGIYARRQPEAGSV